MNDSKVLFTTVEDEKLVEIVAKHPSLYDIQNPVYREQVAKDNAWKEIAEHLGRSAEDCKKRWRNIRDTYKRRKRKGRGLYPTSSKAKKWALAEMLSFLHNVENKCSSRPTSNIGSDPLNNNDVDDSSNLDYDNSDVGINESSDVFQDFSSTVTIQNDKDNNTSEHYHKRTSKPSTGSSRQSSTREKLNEKIMKLMEEIASERNDILKIICQREEDSVDLFYRSVALSIKQLRTDLINEAKIRTLQLVFELEKRNSLPLQPGIESACSSRSTPSPEQKCDSI